MVAFVAVVIDAKVGEIGQRLGPLPGSDVEVAEDLVSGAEQDDGGRPGIAVDATPARWIGNRGAAGDGNGRPPGRRRSGIQPGEPRLRASTGLGLAPAAASGGGRGDDGDGDGSEPRGSRPHRWERRCCRDLCHQRWAPVGSR